MISGHEDASVEFKSSARWNYRKGAQDPEIELAMLKTIAGFLNAKGGTLLIGVDDKGKILGVENDVKLQSAKTRDAFGLWLGNFLMSAIGKTAMMITQISFKNVEEKDVCRVDVSPSPKPVFVNVQKLNIEDEFFVRMNNQTQHLSKRELLDYEKQHWGIG